MECFPRKGKSNEPAGGFAARVRGVKPVGHALAYLEDPFSPPPETFSPLFTPEVT